MDDYFRQHWVWIAVIIICVAISGRLIAGLWISHPHDPILRKLFWSVILLAPFFGWIFYGAFYTPLAENDIKASMNADAYGGH